MVVLGRSCPPRSTSQLLIVKEKLSYMFSLLSVLVTAFALYCMFHNKQYPKCTDCFKIFNHNSACDAEKVCRRSCMCDVQDTKLKPQE